MGTKVAAEPFDYPLVGDLEPERCCLLVVDFQRDITCQGGYYHTGRGDLGPAAQVLALVGEVMRVCRSKGFRIAYSRHGFRPDLADVTPYLEARYAQRGAAIGGHGPLGRLFIRGELGWEIHPAIAPRGGELVVDRAASSAFVGTDLDAVLRGWGVDKLIVCGASLESAVQSTLRSAADLGYQNLLLADCCAGLEAGVDGTGERGEAFVAAVRAECGSFGAAADSASLLAALGERGGTRLEVLAGVGQKNPVRTASPLPASVMMVPSVPRAARPRRLLGQWPGQAPPRPQACEPGSGALGDSLLED